MLATWASGEGQELVIPELRQCEVQFSFLPMLDDVSRCPMYNVCCSALSVSFVQAHMKLEQVFVFTVSTCFNPSYLRV